MKRTTDITSVETRASFREKMIEKYVKNNLPPKMQKESKTVGMPGFTNRYKEFECCAAELPVHGTIEILFSPNHSAFIKRMSYPAKSRFIVFCIRTDDTDYKVAWSCSLS